jgi:anti-sigma factor RsiW
MTCPPFETLSAAVDGDLTELESASLMAHLQACGGECRVRLDDLRGLKQTIHAWAPAPVSGDALEQRLREAPGVRQRSRRNRIGTLAGGLMVALVAAAFIVPVLRERRALAELIGDHVDITVKREEAFDVVGAEPGSLERWFEGKISFPLHIPRVPEARLVGARLCNVAGRHIPLASYELGTERVSMFVDRANRRPRAMVCEEQVHGFTVCRRTVDGLEYLFVSDLPAGQAGNIMTAALGPEQTQ